MGLWHGGLWHGGLWNGGLWNGGLWKTPLGPPSADLIAYFKDGVTDSVGVSATQYVSQETEIPTGGNDTYYISSSLGDDSRTSTQAQDPETPWKHHPWSNLATGGSAGKKYSLAPGDTLVLARGDVWWDTTLESWDHGTAENPITTTSSPLFGTGELPCINAASLLDGTWTATGVNGEYKIALPVETFVVYWGDIELESGIVGSLGDLGFGWSASELYVKIGQDPTGESIQAAAGYAIFATKNYSTFSALDIRYSNATTQGAVYAVTTTPGFTLEGCIISRSRTYAIRCLSAPGPKIINNTIITKDGSVAGVLLDSAVVGGVVFDNDFQSGNGNAMSLSSDSVTVERNTFSGYYGIILQGDSNIIRDNNFSCWNGLEYGSGGSGYDIVLQNAASNNLVVRNVFIEGYVNLRLESSSGGGLNTIAFNVFSRSHVNGVGVGTSGTTTNPDKVVYNTFVHSPTAGDGGIGHAIYISSMSIHGSECNKAFIKNNLFVGETSGTEVMSFDGYLSAYPAAMSAFDINNNFYWQRNTGSRWRLTDVDAFGTDSFSTWKSTLTSAGVTGADANSISVTGESPDVLVDIDNDFFQLAKNCLAINAGINTHSDGDGDQYDADGYQVWSDIFDAPVYHWRDGVDIGAYAYGGGSKVYNNPTVVSGTTWDDQVWKFPICPTLKYADDGTIYTGYVPNEIPAAIRRAWAGDQFWSDNVKEQAAIYATVQVEPNLTKIDKYFGVI